MDVKNNKEDTEDNKAVVVDMLDGDNNTVNVLEDGGVKTGGQKVHYTQQQQSENQHHKEKMITTMGIKQAGREVFIPIAAKITRSSL